MKVKTAKDELSPLVEELVELAGARGLTVVPAVPAQGPGACVRLHLDAMSPEAFLDLAVAAGQKLTYLESWPFNIADIGELALEDEDLDKDLDPVVRDQLAELRKSALRCTGWPIRVQVAFVSEGIVHRWTADAQWYEQLEADVADVLPEDEPAPHLSEAEEAAIVERLAQELLALPEFRAAGNENGRRRVARAHLTSPGRENPGGRLSDSLTYSASRRAIDRAMAEEQCHYAGAEQRIPDLVQLIAADPAYCGARTAPARKHRVRDYLMAQADGYPPPTRLLDLLLDALAASRASRSGPGPELPFLPD